MRAYRPSCFADFRTDDEQEIPRQKLANFRRYCRRARKGLPLFEESTHPIAEPEGKGPA